MSRQRFCGGAWRQAVHLADSHSPQVHRRNCDVRSVLAPPAAAESPPHRFRVRVIPCDGGASPIFLVRPAGVQWNNPPLGEEGTPRAKAETTDSSMRTTGP